MFRFKCAGCGEWHEEMPSIGFEMPDKAYEIPPEEFTSRCCLGPDICIIDDELLFVRACLPISVHGSDDPFVWSVWAELEVADFIKFANHLEIPKRSHIGPFLGWLANDLPLYPPSHKLRLAVIIRDDGLRPLISLAPRDHQLVKDHHDGITMERLREIWTHWEAQWVAEGFVEAGRCG